MLPSLRMYCQYSMGVDQKILSIRKESMLSVLLLISLILHVVEHLASAGK